MNRLSRLAVSMICPVLFAGCSSIAGRWESAGVQPARAADYFNIARATFNHDGTYQVTVDEGGTTRSSSGSYKYCCGKLQLHPAGGPERSYGAHLDLSGKELRVEHQRPDGSDVTVKLQKIGCADDCLCKHCESRT